MIGPRLCETGAVIGWNEARTREAYDEVADTYANHFTATEPELHVELAMVDHFVGLLRPSREVLDAGCGAGRLLPYLAKRGCAVRGVDLSPGMVRRAALDHPEYPVRVGSLTDLPFGDAAFDGVFCWYSTIHSPDTDLPVIFSEVKRVLRPSGLVLVGFQIGDEARDVGDGYRARGHDVTLMRYGRSPQLMRDALTTAGFLVIAALERAAAGHEQEGQAVLVARASPL